MAFTHLHVHTRYSRNGAFGTPMTLVRYAYENGMHSLAVTDTGSMAGVIEFYNSMHSVNGPSAKPVIGCEFYIKESDNTGYITVVLLAKNKEGFGNLCVLSSSAQLNGDGKYISFNDLSIMSEGMICLLRISSVEYDSASWHLERFKVLFDEDLYIEIIRDENNDHDEKAMRLDLENEILYRLSSDTGVKTAATNNVCFPSAEDAPAGRTAWLKSEELMRHLFRDHPESIDNTEEILNKIESFKLFDDGNKKVKCKNKDLFTDMVYTGAEKYLEKNTAEIKERLAIELDYFCRTELPSYILILKRAVDHTRNKGITVGPGKGTMACSLVNYCLGLTEINPLDYGLSFDMFINKDRTRYPIYRFDLGEGGRREMLQYMKTKLKDGHLFRTMHYIGPDIEYAIEKAAVVTGLPSGEKEILLDMVSRNYFHNISDAVENNPVLQCLMKKDDNILMSVMTAQRLEKETIDVSRPCENLFLLGNKNLTGILPMSGINESFDGISFPVCQFDAAMDPDLPGFLIELSSLPALHSIQELTGHSIDLDDKSIYEMMSEGDTDGLLYYEKERVRRVLRMVRPDSIDELADVFAMTYRGVPSERKMIIYRLVKTGRVIHEETSVVEDILSKTKGLILYQDQLMRLGSDVAGLSGDMSVQMATAFKSGNMKDIKIFHSRFMDGGIKNGFAVEYLEKLYDMMIQEGPHACMKSHAVSMAIMGYKSALMKKGCSDYSS